MWNKAQEIRKKRYKENVLTIGGTREKFTRKYALSSLCECGFCGTKLTRRAHNQDTHSTKPVWKCRTATNKGKDLCPHSKALDEVIIENAFLEVYRLLSVNFDDVLDSVLATVEDALANEEDIVRLKKIEKSLSAWESKRKKLTDMLLDDTISKEAYDEKYNDFTDKINQSKNEKELLMLNLDSKKNIKIRMKDLRERLSEVDMLDEFDRVVFESIVEKVIVGETNEDGSIDPYKLTFVLKGNGYKAIPDAKERYISLCKKQIS
ncbi:zinc ribbon domain-containing protein [Anaerocolumna sp. MB42-C2]|uniref:zinc ribbon domain-containing protein n=1 Tax=Anaerocolumna sp. MB42-C2 TaxID=3070997 RepID=UPI0027E0B03D|nr:zinc ribbon domain-containing protein [Anaerocolumna sp. MB42-C2]WMJ90753.1 zinc ribbon domain-containing protein [Anaerocolumna sp. MB42-C2]